MDGVLQGGAGGAAGWGLLPHGHRHEREAGPSQPLEEGAKGTSQVNQVASTLFKFYMVFSSLTLFHLFFLTFLHFSVEDWRRTLADYR
jgi:hypothetical protein